VTTNSYDTNANTENHDDENNAESFDEDLLVDEGDDDTDVSGQFPADRYVGATDRAVTPSGEAIDDTLEERVAREERDPIVDELDRNARAEEAEEKALGIADRDTQTAPIEAQLADLEDNWVDTAQ
jgi:hypothetical protein